MLLGRVAMLFSVSIPMPIVVAILLTTAVTAAVAAAVAAVVAAVVASTVASAMTTMAVVLNQPKSFHGVARHDLADEQIP